MIHESYFFLYVTLQDLWRRVLLRELHKQIPHSLALCYSMHWALSKDPWIIPCGLAWRVWVMSNTRTLFEACDWWKAGNCGTIRARNVYLRNIWITFISYQGSLDYSIKLMLSLIMSSETIFTLEVECILRSSSLRVCLPGARAGS